MTQSLAKVLLALCMLGLAYMMLLLWVKYPDNHGAGPGSFKVYFLSMLIIALLLCIWKSGFAIWAVACSLLGLLLVWIVDERNMMVNYDVWIAKGMPKWGQDSTGTVEVPARNTSEDSGGETK